MSRIYEAMRQAELDSAKRSPTEPVPTAPASAFEAQPVPAERIVPAPMQSPPTLQPAPTLQSTPTIQALPIAQPEEVLPAYAAPEPQPTAPFTEPAPVAPIASSAANAVPEPLIEAPPPPRTVPATSSIAQPVPATFRHTVPVARTTIAPIDEQFNPDNIAQVTWVPSLHQLPALEHRGAAVEQFRSLRSRMQEFRDLNTLKSIMVSSGLPQEGKSFVTANLAISFARHKANRVLLIDGDMRRSSLHKLLGAPQGPGLTEYLAGKASLAQIMQRPRPSDSGHPLPHGLVSLVFIPGGHAADKAADLSGNRRFDRLIADASPFFDWIVVDSSPVNLVSDGVNLARSCDGVLLIAREGTTKYEVAQRALAELKASKVLGFVLNAVKDPPNTGGYYGYDGYSENED